MHIMFPNPDTVYARLAFIVFWINAVFAKMGKFTMPLWNAVLDRLL